jgi:peptide/nickel transport system substrate-binding protein
MGKYTETPDLSRRMFLTTASAVLAGAALGGLAPRSEAAQRHPQRHGVLEFGTRTDTAGLDSHRNNQLHTSTPTAAMYTGLADYDQQGNIIPGIAESWEPNKDLTAWVFKLRKGVLFHNGREVDAEAVKLNIEHIKNPAIGSDWHRGAIENIASAEVVDKYTIRFHTSQPDAGVPIHVLHYPTNLQAPDSFEKASEHPIGTGPFKFVSWTRWNESRMVRFENYWETDAAGNNLPYLDEIIGKPKREDSVRLTALRTGQINVIDALAFADVKRFKETHSDEYNVWTTHFGGIFMVFNFTNGPFQDKRLRTAAAHAIDRNAIHFSVFYEQGNMLDQPYPIGNPWHVESESLQYDPDKAKSILKQARAVGTELKIICTSNIPYARECGQIVQEQWNSVGFKTTLEPLDTVPLIAARRERAFDGLVQGNTLRFDPDDFYGRNLLSTSRYAQVLSGWKNERYDQLITEAKRTLDPARRKALYTQGWSIVNQEVPHFHLHEVVLTSAGIKALKGYQPGATGSFSYHGGGIRTAYIEA